MKKCFQFTGVDMLQHGRMVHHWYNNLIGEFPEVTARIPDWFDFMISAHIDILHKFEQEIRTYHVYHDCGKPFCVPDGKRKYPDHARKSKEVWENLDRMGRMDLLMIDHRKIAFWMEHDMIIHTYKPGTIESDFLESGIWKKEDAVILLLTALAECHANATMFGGFQSDSFKAKVKKVDKAGKRIKKFYYGKD